MILVAWNITIFVSSQFGTILFGVAVCIIHIFCFTEVSKIKIFRKMKRNKNKTLFSQPCLSWMLVMLFQTCFSVDVTWIE
jgi:hypothetical protein